MINRPLLRRLTPYPNESLGSFLCRLEIENFYPGNFIKNMLRTSYLNFPFLPNSIHKFIFLEHLTTIPLRKLYKMSIHNYWQNNNLNKERTIQYRYNQYYFHRPSELNRLFIPQIRMQYCSKCLSMEEKFVHKNWSFPFNTICIEHKQYLLKECPFCKKKISVYEIISNNCSKCQNSLNSFSGKNHKISKEQINTEMKLLNIMFNGKKYKSEFSINKTPFDEYFQIRDIFLYLVKNLIVIYQEKKRNFYLLDQNILHWAKEQAIYIIDSWPYGFHLFLLIQVKKDKPIQYPRSRNIYSEYYWNDNLIKNNINLLQNEIQNFQEKIFRKNQKERNEIVNLIDTEIDKHLKADTFFDVNDFSSIFEYSFISK